MKSIKEVLKKSFNYKKKYLVIQATVGICAKIYNSSKFSTPSCV